MKEDMKNLKRLRYDKIPEPKKDKPWEVEHHLALVMSIGPERGILSLIESWLVYADRHQQRYKTSIGNDYFLGPAWARIGLAIRTLLSGELGRLDGGTLDTVILDTLSTEGFDENGEQLGEEEK